LNRLAGDRVGKVELFGVQGGRGNQGALGLTRL
jgi:hypothetical protein